MTEFQDDPQEAAFQDSDTEGHTYRPNGEGRPEVPGHHGPATTNPGVHGPATTNPGATDGDEASA